MDPTLEAALLRLRRSLEDLRGVVRGMPAEGLNWPPVADSNSIAAQVAHLLKSAEFNLGGAAHLSADLQGYQKPRSETFHFGADSMALIEMLDEFDSSLAGRLMAIDSGSLGKAIDWQDGTTSTVAYSVVGAVEHMREHVGAAALTRQLWEQRNQG